MKIHIRQATEGDAPDACEVIRCSILECCGDDHGGNAKVLEGWLRNKTPEFLREIILAPKAFSVVASVDGEIVGFGSVLEAREVTLCYVTPSVRFKRVGKAVLAALERHAVSAGADALRLESTRTAKPFYLRNGFKVEGPPILAFLIEGQSMRKALVEADQ